MNVLNRRVTSRVLQPFFSIAPIAALLAGAFVSSAQSQSTNLQVSGAVAPSTVSHRGVTLGGEAWVDGGPLRKNLVVNNPGFEAADYRAILRCRAVTADGCAVSDAATGGAGGFWNGAHYQVMSGGSAGAAGTVVSHSSDDGGSVLALDKGLKLSVGDYVSVEALRSASGVAEWRSSASAGGAITAETTDLSPETFGKQALLLSAPGRGGSVRLSQEVDGQPGRRNLRLNGAYELSFRAKGVGGNNKLDLNVAREAIGSAPYLNREVALTGSWAQYTLSFSVAETGTQSSPLQLSFAAAGANIELDDVALRQSNSNSANATEFRDEVVNALEDLHPGTIRMVSMGSDVLSQLASPFARYGQGFNGQGVGSDVASAQERAYGIQEFLELCATVGADPWITIPVATTPTEMRDLIQYLTGNGSDIWSTLRMTRGQAEPWTSVFGRVHIELDDRTRVIGTPGEHMDSSAYADWSGAVFGAARRSPGYSANKIDLIASGSAASTDWGASMLSSRLSSSRQQDTPISTALLSSIAATGQTPAATLSSPVKRSGTTRKSSPVAASTSSTVGSASSQTVINCASGFASSGACGVALTGGSGQPFQLTDAPQGVLSGTQVSIIPVTPGHDGSGLIYQKPVNVQAFSATFTFVPDGSNVAFVLQNNTNLNAAYGGLGFAAGAGCEGGFYQAYDSGNPTYPNNIVAVELDQVLPEIQGGQFTYSNTQLYTTGQNPCNGNKISTSPVPLNSPAGTAFTSTGDTYSVTMNYNGSTLSMSMYDVTAGGSCPGASCFTQSWPSVNIPAMVGSNTAIVGFTGGYNGSVPHTLLISSFTYTVLSSGSTPAAAPTFSPVAGTYASSQSVTISDSTPGATIHFTTNGTTPSTSSPVYSGPITVSSTETLEAMAVASGYSNSSVTSAAYVIDAVSPTPATPKFSVAAGTYTSTQTVSISDATSGATIYYTTNGSTPTTSSTKYAGAITVSSTETLEAVASVGDPTISGVASATYVIESPSVDFPSGGFKASSLDLNGGAAITSNGFLQLTDGGYGEARTAWFATKMPVQTFTTDFTFEQLNANADGITFTIQGQGPGAFGGTGGSLGYQGISTSVAVKFDLYDNQGEGVDSTGLYTDGAAPTVPSINLSSTPINLHSGDVMHAHIVYDGANLTMTLTDTVTGGSVTEVFPVNIPSVVGGDTAYVGFTGGTGGETSTQNILSWTYSVGESTSAPTFSPVAGTYSAEQVVAMNDDTAGATIYFTLDGTTPTTSSIRYYSPTKVSASKTIKAVAVASGHTNSSMASAAYNIGGTSSASPSMDDPSGGFKASSLDLISGAATVPEGLP